MRLGSYDFDLGKLVGGSLQRLTWGRGASLCSVSEVIRLDFDLQAGILEPSRGQMSLLNNGPDLVGVVGASSSLESQRSGHRSMPPDEGGVIIKNTTIKHPWNRDHDHGGVAVVVKGFPCSKDRFFGKMRRQKHSRQDGARNPYHKSHSRNRRHI